MAAPDGSLEARDFPWLVVLSLVFFGLVAAGFWREYQTQWGSLQERFVAILMSNGRVADARKFQPGIHQIWIPKLGVVDRCTTCHLGYDYTGVLAADLPEPFTPHSSPNLIAKHPFSRFGCTPCHGGQGWATERVAAHRGGEHWDDPLLSPILAARYNLSAGELMQMRCNFCHRHDVSTPGMGEIDLGKALFKKKKCIVCHTVEGKGGLVGPDLTYYGDKDPELYDFGHLSGPETTFNWNFQHFMNPGKVTPASTMPVFGFTTEQARALTLLVMSWRRQSFAPEYIPPRTEAVPIQVIRKVAEAPVVAGAEEGRLVFTTHGCNQCHSVGGGLLIGPDLRGVGGRHPADWLRNWLADPAAMIRAHPELAEWPEQFGGIVMPNQNLTAKQIDALVVYLGKL